MPNERKRWVSSKNFENNAKSLIICLISASLKGFTITRLSSISIASILFFLIETFFLGFMVSKYEKKV